MFPSFIKMFCVISSVSIGINSNLECIQIEQFNEKMNISNALNVKGVNLSRAAALWTYLNKIYTTLVEFKRE